MRYRPPYISILSLSVIFLGVFTLGGCDSGPSGPGDPDDNSTLIPLEEGNTWTMSVEGDFAPDGETVTLRVGAETTINNNSYREIERSTSSSGTFSNSNIVASNRPNGVYIARRDLSDLYGFLVRTDVSGGDTYIHTDERGNSYDVNVSEQTITVPAGTFDVLAYRVTRQSNGNTDSALIAPGFGPIQLDFRGEIYRLESTNVE